MSRRIFSGVQPSGVLHLGNYLGAVRNWIELQKKDYESIFCVVDLHAITVPQKPEELRKNTLETAKTFLAAGIDPEKSIVFVQSQVPEHAELAWILNAITKIAELERMTQFKDKSRENKKNINMGLFSYPVLMAADILLYDTEIVPVGEDQIQHVELARDIAKRFNNTFGETFIIPKPNLTKEGMRIMGLDDPTKKMSKSASSAYNYIALNDEPDAVREKIMRAVTDSGKTVKYSDDRPALKNLLNIYALLDNATPREIAQSYRGKGYAEFKKDLAEIVVDFLKNFQEKFNNIDDGEVLKILEEGREKAGKIAKEKMEIVREKIGLL